MARRLSDAEASMFMRNAGLEPLEPYPGVAKPWRCRCKVCGVVGSPRYHNIKKGRGGCEPCGITKRALSRKVGDDLAVAAMEAAGVTPLEAYPGARSPWRCRCNYCGKELRLRLPHQPACLRSKCSHLVPAEPTGSEGFWSVETLAPGDVRRHSLYRFMLSGLSVVLVWGFSPIGTSCG